MKARILLPFVLTISLTSCTTERERTTQEFVSHVHNLNIDGIKNLCTEDTKFYLKMTIEGIMSLGEEKDLQQLQKMASTLECSGENDSRECFYLDNNGQKHSFDLEFVEGQDDQGEDRLLIHIDKKHFLGEI